MAILMLPNSFQGFIKIILKTFILINLAWLFYVITNVFFFFQMQNIQNHGTIQELMLGFINS